MRDNRVFTEHTINVIDKHCTEVGNGLSFFRSKRKDYRHFLGVAIVGASLSFNFSS